MGCYYAFICKNSGKPSFFLPNKLSHIITLRGITDQVILLVLCIVAESVLMDALRNIKFNTEINNRIKAACKGPKDESKTKYAQSLFENNKYSTVRDKMHGLCIFKIIREEEVKAWENSRADLVHEAFLNKGKECIMDRIHKILTMIYKIILWRLDMMVFIQIGLFLIGRP